MRPWIRSSTTTIRHSKPVRTLCVKSKGYQMHYSELRLHATSAHDSICFCTNGARKYFVYVYTYIYICTYILIHYISHTSIRIYCVFISGMFIRYISMLLYFHILIIIPGYFYILILLIFPFALMFSLRKNVYILVC